ncbi:hypothetical protein DQ353_17375 [Arthrobacter sp. AQ5-05]|uniref:hypothetical protein n=1 Tax=Arthrobacter sp. AQ5-05 TaxID=2184581 RepID=UPI000DCF30BF|nr:hypothetical protein [Arthrobacter sp. AQ5-05]RAX48053.1 hypothetical protein DQ353_17375 [Arthrobacter sp. AQ5-05]
MLSSSGDFSLLYAHATGTAYRDALPEPPRLPWSWIDEWEIESYVSDYSRSGFHGGINWYLAADSNWEYRRRRGTNVTAVPLYFTASEADVQLAEQHGARLGAQLAQSHADVRALRTIQGGGYLLAMERAREVSETFIEFLRELDSTHPAGTPGLASVTAR